MLPANQGLRAYQCLGTQIDFGLKMQNKFVLGDGLAQAGHQMLQTDRRFSLHNIKDCVLILALLLCLIHGLIGVAHQQISFSIISGIKRYPDADSNDELHPCNMKWLRRNVQQTFYYRKTVNFMLKAIQHSNKFVSADA